MKLFCLVFIVVSNVALTAVAQHKAGEVLWVYDLTDWAVSSPAVAADGTVYVGASTGLSAITNNGVTASNKWSFPFPIGGSSPALGSDGTIYVGSSDGNLYAIAPNGSKNWSYPVSGGGGSPAVGADNSIYVQGAGYLYSLSASGTLRWRSAMAAAERLSSPVIGADGTLYVTSYSASALYAFGSDGTQKWAQGGTSHSGDSAAIGPDGAVFAAMGPLFAFTAGGTQIWASAGFYDGASPVVAKNGTVFIKSADDHQLYALGANGQVLWQTMRDLQRYAPPTAPAIDIAGVLYYCVSNSVVALTQDGQVKWVLYGGDSIPGVYLASTSPVIGQDGTIYAALGTKVYAIASGTNAPAGSAWPMYRHDARHTGSLQKTVLQQPKKRSDANFEFQLYAQELGVAYTIETSTNLNTWASWTSVVANTLPTEVADLTATNSSAKFYRAYSPP